MSKRALVCGAGGFIGRHLVDRLKNDGYWVRGVGRHAPPSDECVCDEFLVLDLRDRDQCDQAVRLDGSAFEEVYQFAADMGGIGYITDSECDILRNNTLIDLNLIDSAATTGAKKYFLASSVCVYRDMLPGEAEMKEAEAYPANPDNEYGWEKLFSERVASAYARKFPIEVHIGRLQTVYGPGADWDGGKEKAPAAICRKVAELGPEGGTIEVWGDGTAVRSYLYCDDVVDAIRRLMDSEIKSPVNIGSPEYVSVKELVDMIIDLSGKQVEPVYVPGPVGVQSRNFSNEMIYSTGWQPCVSLREGIETNYHWIEQQMNPDKAP
jgi:GDP-D-mannose 3',5'-epimerase